MYLIKNLTNSNLKYIANAVNAKNVRTTKQIMTGNSDLALITSFNDRSQIITIVDNNNGTYLSILYYKKVALQGLTSNNITSSIKHAHMEIPIINHMAEVQKSAE